MNAAVGSAVSVIMPMILAAASEKFTPKVTDAIAAIYVTASISIAMKFTVLMLFFFIVILLFGLSFVRLLSLLFVFAEHQVRCVYHSA